MINFDRDGDGRVHVCRTLNLPVSFTHNPMRSAILTKVSNFISGASVNCNGAKLLQIHTVGGHSHRVRSKSKSESESGSQNVFQCWYLFFDLFRLFFDLCRFCAVWTWPKGLFIAYSHLPGSDSDSDSDSCTMQKLHIGSDTDSDPLIEI